MTTNLTNFHSWLRPTLPATPSEILHDLQIGHKALPADYDGLPKTAAELSAALIALEKQGLARRGDGRWFWCAEPVKAEPQMTMF